MIQLTAWWLTLVLVAAMIGIFVFVAINATKQPVEFNELKNNSYAIRDKAFVFACVFGLILAIVTTISIDVPFSTTKEKIPSDVKQVNVIGEQWSWELSEEEINVGETIVFNIRSSDVNHGLGIYDKNLTLIGQGNAMPGYTNRLKMKFDEPGDYQIMCMEYCGVAHHGMISEFTVKGKGE